MQKEELIGTGEFYLGAVFRGLIPEISFS